MSAALKPRFLAYPQGRSPAARFPWPVPDQATFSPPPITPYSPPDNPDRPAGAGVVWAGGPFRRDVPPEFNARIAAGPSPWVRMGNFGNVRAAGVPYRRGMGGETDHQHPDGQIVMPGVDVFKFDWRTEKAEIRKILTACQRHGWTLQVSIGDSQRIVQNGAVIFPAWRKPDVIEYMQMARDEFGLLCDPWLLNGGGSPERDGGPPNPFAIRDGQWQDYAALLTPWIDDMQVAGVMPHFTYGWQVDANNRPVYYHEIEIAIRKLVDPRAPAARHTVNDAVTMYDNAGLQPEPTTETLYHVVDRYTCAKFDSGLRSDGHGNWLPLAPCKVDLYLLQVNTEGSVDNVQRAVRSLMDSCQPNQGANLCEYSTKDEFDTPDSRTPVMAAARGLYGSNVIGPRGASDPSQILYGTYNGRTQENGKFCDL